MALTRNDWCVHERHGEYLDIQADGPVGLVLGPDIDLRVFFSSWRSAWAVEQDGRHSLQFFDGEGDVYKRQLLAWLPLSPEAPMQSFFSLVGLSAALNFVVTANGVPALYTPLAETLAQASGFPLMTVLMAQVAGYATVIMPVSYTHLDVYKRQP